MGPTRVLRPVPSAGPSPTFNELCDDQGIRDAYTAHGGELYRFAVQSLHDPGSAEEAVQETLVRAWRHCERFDAGLASLRTWLFAIIRNVIIDIARARAVRPPLARVDPSSSGAPTPVTEDAIEPLLLSWQLEEALRRISDEHREAIVETHYRGRPHAEVAAELGVPIGTVRSRVFYGLKALRLALEEMGWNE